MRCHIHSRRLIVNAWLYWSKSRCQLRLLPQEFPPFPLVYCYFRRWQAEVRWAGQVVPCAPPPPAGDSLTPPGPEQRGLAQCPIHQMQ
ncbi:transposase [Hymenobacter sp. BT770]|uniref:transposase n=1 Tax=Hymenobacter sp. BT770 TaxID=2886942 RepID=UPI001D1008EE|nr:transposase [Hymenobacter sp. BT770]